MMKVMMQQLAELTTMALETEIEIFVETGKLTQADHGWITRPNRPEAMLIRSYECASTRASLRSSLAPAGKKRSRKRSSCFGLMEKT
jgi:hypothetical protein